MGRGSCCGGCSSRNTCCDDSRTYGYTRSYNRNYGRNFNRGYGRDDRNNCGCGCGSTRGRSWGLPTAKLVSSLGYNLDRLTGIPNRATYDYDY